MPPKRTQGASGSCAGQTEPDDHAIGRSRGGLTTKIQLACDGHGRPLPVLWTGGQAGDTTRFADLPAGIRFPRRPGPGRPPLARTGSWPTGRIPAARSAPTSVVVGSAWSFPNVAITRTIAATVPGQVAAHPLRPRGLQVSQRGRALLQPAQALPGHRHPLGQNRPVVPSHARSSHPHHLAVRTEPRSPRTTLSGRR
ncbi:hypothetical protein H4W33_010575 [Kibdelosporangium phytohabitans]|nr:hypothetical protein [Kibdelosporangium phytohabitans]